MCALLLAGALLRVWRADLDVPFTYEAEVQYYVMLAKTMEDHGGFLENPNLGAPFGLDLHDYAVGTDRLHLWLIRALTAVSGDPVAAINVFFLLTFALTAAAAFLVFRLLRVGSVPSAVCSVLFALAPYHFARGEGHLFLSAYYAVPLGAFLVLATIGGEPLFPRRPGQSGARAYLSGRGLMSAAFCLVLASTGIYYAAFTLVLLAAAVALALLGRGGWRAAASGAVCIALILVGLLVNLAPTLAYRFEHGVNTETQRSPIDTELLALKFPDLILPPADSASGPLSRLTATYQAQTPIRSEGGQSLGFVAAAGFLALLVIALLALVARSRAGPPVVRDAAAVTLVCFVVGTVGGGSALVAHMFTSQIRAWNRISIVIAFFALLAVAVGLDWLRRRVRSRALFAVAVAAVAVAGLYVQATSEIVPPYEASAAEYRSDRDFVRAIDRRLPPDASVFVLPYVAFPETGRLVDLSENDLLRGYLHSDELRWSFGAMKGRPEDWSRELSALPPAAVVDAAAAAGFSGIYVDRFGYGDRAAGLEAELAARTGDATPLIAASGRQSFFDLTARRRRLGATRREDEIASLREAVLRPLRFSTSGTQPLLRSGRYFRVWADSPQAELRIVNRSNRERTAVFEASLERVGGPETDVVVSFPGSAPVTTKTPVTLRRELTLPPGTTVIRFSTVGPPVEANNANELRRHYFRLENLAVVDSGFKGLL